MPKKTILTFIGYYLPGYKSGGPVRTISNMVDLLHENYDFKVVTRDRDMLENKPYDNIKINDWNDYPHHKVYYTNKDTKLADVINKTEFDVYYLNSFFDYNFSIKIMLLLKAGKIPVKPVLLAPRGELMSGALSLKSFKKKFFIKTSNISGIYKNITWHASSEYEAEEIKREMGRQIKLKIAMDVPDPDLRKVERTRVKKADELKILYLASITPKKNLLFAIEVLNKVEGNFTFDIYGSIKDEKYWRKCLNHISGRIKDRVTYKGIVPNDQIHTIYPNYDIFFFPTLGENYGHVIYESLYFGTPVLCSDRTPWDRLDEFVAGWNIELAQQKRFVDRIDELTFLEDVEYKKFINGCSDYHNSFRNSNIKNDNLKLFYS
ncbi:MAG: glycosyltransferase family 4 protein [bacterium]